MFIYYLILIVCCFFGILDDVVKNRKDKKGLNFFYILACGILILFAVLRSDTIGKDTYYFKLYFNNLLNGVYGDFSNLPYEIGFNYFTILFQYFSTDFQMFLSICSILTLVPILYIMRKENRAFIWLALLVFITTQYASSFSILRGYLSLANLFIAYYYINKKESKIKYWFFIIIAVSLHYSALIYVFVFWIGKKRFKFYHYLIGIFGIFLLAIPSSPIKNVILKIFITLKPHYSSNAFDETSSSIVYTSIFSFILILCVVYYKKLIKGNSKNIILINLAFTMLLLNIGGTWIPANSRISSESLAFMVFLIPEIIICEKNAYLRVLYCIVFSFIFIAFMYLNLYSPYEFR